MVLQDCAFHLGERGLYRLQLGQDLDAVSLVLDHPGDALHLARDAGETFDRSGVGFVHG